MPLYNFMCECGHKWEVFRHIQDDVSDNEWCPNCMEKGRRDWRARVNEFTPYWTDGLTGNWEHIDSRHTEVKREKETGMTRLPNAGPSHLSRPSENEARRYGT